MIVQVTLQSLSGITVYTRVFRYLSDAYSVMIINEVNFWQTITFNRPTHQCAAIQPVLRHC